MTEVSPAKPGRPRDQDIKRSIYRAALKLAKERGYYAVTLRDIAAQAKTGRQTIYRWWPTKAHLYLDILIEQTALMAKAASPRQADLKTYFCQAFTFMRQYNLGLMTIGVLAEIQHSPELLARYRPLVTERRRLLVQMLEQHAHVRQANYRVPIADVAEALAGAIWYRLLHQHAQLDDNFAEELAGLANALFADNT